MTLARVVEEAPRTVKVIVVVCWAFVEVCCCLVVEDVVGTIVVVRVLDAELVVTGVVVADFD